MEVDLILAKRNRVELTGGSEFLRNHKKMVVLVQVQEKQIKSKF